MRSLYCLSLPEEQAGMTPSALRSCGPIADARRFRVWSYSPAGISGALFSVSWRSGNGVADFAETNLATIAATDSTACAPPRCRPSASSTPRLSSSCVREHSPAPSTLFRPCGLCAVGHCLSVSLVDADLYLVLLSCVCRFYFSSLPARMHGFFPGDCIKIRKDETRYAADAFL